MLKQIRNVYCVGRNYALHASELGNAVPAEPMLFMKPTHAIVEMNGQTIHLPANRGEIHYEAELVLHVGRSYERGIRVDDLIDTMTLGIDFTLRDVQNELKKKGHPWLAAKGFLQSAPLGNFIPFKGEKAAAEHDFTLQKNGAEVQRGNIAEMIFNLQTIVDYCAYHFGLDKGDIIYTGTPAGVGKTENGDHFLLSWGMQSLGECTIANAT